MLIRRYKEPRRGTIVPMMAFSVTAMFSFVALAIDLGMLAVARTECQNAADAAALAGTRILDNKPTTSTTYRNNSLAAGKAAMATLSGRSASDGSSNTLLNSKITPSKVSSIRFGVYSYTDAGRFDLISYSSNVANNSYTPSLPGAPPPSQSWAATEVVINGDTPTFFAKVLGVNSMNLSARALAVHRPRDVAIVLDFSGSMAFGSQFSYPDFGETSDRLVRGLLNPDPNIPRFAHYQRYDNYRTTAPSRSDFNASSASGRSHPLVMRQAYVRTDTGETFAASNFTTETPSGPAIVKDFLTGGSSNPSGNAFHHWEPTQLTSISTTRPDPNLPPIVNPPTFSYSGYDSVYNRNSVTMPAPDSFGTQFTSSPYIGDKSPRKKGVVANTTWDPTVTNGAAVTLAEYLGWSDEYSGGSSVQPVRSNRTAPPPTGLGLNPTYSPTTNYNNDGSNFRDATWERYGYDLDVADYVTNRTSGSITWDPRWDWDIGKNALTVPTRQTGSTPSNSEFNDYYPFTKSTAPSIIKKPKLKTTAERYKGYTMGPGYWGKTFFVWPPDPRFDDAANLNSPDVDNPGFDTGGKAMCDWRQHFFLKNVSGTTSSFSPSDNINQILLSNGSNQPTLKKTGTSSTNTAWKVNYDAVLAWLKAGPRIFPDDLRAGRCLYYSAIPSTIPQSGSMTEDQRFWREYIDYVVGYQANGNDYDPGKNLAGYDVRLWPDQLSSSVPNSTPSQYVWLDSSVSHTDVRLPYMHYTDNPPRPRMQMWFGPYSMMDFLQCRTRGWNLNAGTLHEAQTWQLKAGIQSSLDDIRNNHPNDFVGMTYFAASYNDRRVPMGQQWDRLKNTLFFPYNRINTGNGSLSGEWRPYSNGFGAADRRNLPNAAGGTDPGTGLSNAYNLLSTSTALNPSGTGRRGAAKIVIFETDGVPNTLTNAIFVADGPQSYYKSTSSGAGKGNGSSEVINQALGIVDQIVIPANNSTGTNSGHSLPNSPARVYAIGFGDLFDAPTASARQSALDFLRDVAIRGNTLNATATALPADHIITGDYTQRIDRLRVTIERIMQSGVQVTLIE